MRVRLRVVAKSLRSTTSPLEGITATLITLGTGAGPWLLHHGHGGLAVYASRVPGWWPVVPASILVILAVVRAAWALEGEPDADPAQRKADAVELGALRLRMRKRHHEWAKEQNQGVRMLGFAAARAHALQNDIGAMLGERYGIHVRNRFIGAADESPKGYAGRIRRLRDIVTDIRRGRIKRR